MVRDVDNTLAAFEVADSCCPPGGFCRCSRYDVPVRCIRRFRKGYAFARLADEHWPPEPKDAKASGTSKTQSYEASA